MRSLLRFLLVLAMIASTVFAAATTAESAVVTDGDFVGGVYEFRYDTWNNQALVNGTSTGNFNNLFLTNAGNTPNAAWERVTDGTIHFLQAPGANGGFSTGGVNSTWNTSAAATMGWDFSAVTGQIASIEMMGSNAIFQFSPWGDEAAGDKIFADVATPATFGAGTYANVWTFVSNNPNNLASEPSALASGGLVDITSNINASWLSNPNLLELRFGYELLNTDIPGRHLQLFRDTTSGVGPSFDGFRLRVTLAQQPVPEPTSLIAWAGMAAVGLTAARQRKRKAVRPA